MAGKALITLSAISAPVIAGKGDPITIYHELFCFKIFWFRIFQAFCSSNRTFCLNPWDLHTLRSISVDRLLLSSSRYFHLLFHYLNTAFFHNKLRDYLVNLNSLFLFSSFSLYQDGLPSNVFMHRFQFIYLGFMILYLFFILILTIKVQHFYCYCRFKHPTPIPS